MSCDFLPPVPFHCGFTWGTIRWKSRGPKLHLPNQPYNHCTGEYIHSSGLLRDAVHYLSWQVHSASSKSSFTGHQCHKALCPEHSLVTNNPPSTPLSSVTLIIRYSLCLETQASLSPLQKTEETAICFRRSCLCIDYTQLLSSILLFVTAFNSDSLLVSKALCSQTFEHPQVVCKQSRCLWVSPDSLQVWQQCRRMFSYWLVSFEKNYY